MRLEFLPPAGVPVNPHSSSCSSQKPALVPVFPLPHFALPYALGVLISHFLPRPGAWPRTCPSRSCALPGTLCSTATDPSYQEQGPDTTPLLPICPPTASTSDWLPLFHHLPQTYFPHPFPSPGWGTLGPKKWASLGRLKITESWIYVLRDGLLWQAELQKGYEVPAFAGRGEENDSHTPGLEADGQKGDEGLDLQGAPQVS